MTIPFLTDEQFVSRLSLSIFVYVLICITMAYCAKRQPTDYDTLWMRRWRIISGVFWVILAVGSIFVYNHFPLQFYCQNVYGTVTPTQDMITTGISPYLPIHNPEHALVWGRLTFRQWQIETNVTNILRYLALGIYFILFKPSSVKKWVKVRKFIGYVLLLFFFPATINFRYFDMMEIIPVFVVLLIVYLLLRTYKHDAIVPVVKEPLKTSDGSIIEEFAPIAPEEKITIGQKSCDEKNTGTTVRKYFFDILRSNKVLWIASALCEALTIVFAFVGLVKWYYAFAILAVVILSIAILRATKKMKVFVSNTKALKLFQYTAWSTLAEYVFLHLLLFVDGGSWEGVDSLRFITIIFFVYLCFVRIPCMIYVYKQIPKEGDRFYLIPQWLKNFVNSYADSEAPMRAALVFLIYPLFYLCTFPAGIFVLVYYLIPAIVIYVIVFFIMWVIRGTAKQIGE